MNRLTYTGDARLAAVRILAAPCLDGHPAIRAIDAEGWLSVTLTDNWPWSSGEEALALSLRKLAELGHIPVGVLGNGHLDEQSREAVLDAMALLRLGPVAS